MSFTARPRPPNGGNRGVVYSLLGCFDEARAALDASNEEAKAALRRLGADP